MKSNNISYSEMLIAMLRWNPFFPALFVLFFMAGACSDDEGSSQPQAPNPGNIEITIETDGKDDDPDGYVLVVDGSNLETDPNGTYLVENKSPGSYSVELTEIPAHCEGEGELVRQVTVTEDGTVRVNYKVTCKAILRNKILFVKGSTFAAGDFGIYKMDYDGENELLIYDEGISAATTLAISPEGTEVYFHIVTNRGNKIFRMDADGEGAEEIFEGRVIQLSLSPDGSKLALVMSTSPGSEIHVLDLETTDLIKITDEPDGPFYNISWSTDGTKIVMYRQVWEGEALVSSIWEINVDGSNLSQILVDPDYRISSARFSPVDDEVVAFAGQFRTETFGRREIFLADRQLSNPEDISKVIDGQEIRNEYPIWSSDGSKILFLSQFSFQDFQLFQYDVESSQLDQITSEVAIRRNPVFSPVMR